MVVAFPKFQCGHQLYVLQQLAGASLLPLLMLAFWNCGQMISDAGLDPVIVGMTDVFACVWYCSISKFSGLGMFRQTQKKITISVVAFGTFRPRRMRRRDLYEFFDAELVCSKRLKCLRYFIVTKIDWCPAVTEAGFVWFGQCLTAHAV